MSRKKDKAKDLAHSMANEARQQWRTPAVPEQTGILAYHGSPYHFDKFDASKIGTGQGAQSYGHGLYFAGNPETAGVYRDQVKDWAKIDAHNKRLSELAREMEKLQVPGQYRKYKEPRGYELASEYDRLMADKMAPGHRYEVAINAKPEEFLDWDRTLEEQHPKVKRKLQQGWLAHPDVMAGKSGADIYHSLAGNEQILGKNSSDQLRKAGIKGIRYLDQGSRKVWVEQRPDGRYAVHGDFGPGQQVKVFNNAKDAHSFAGQSTTHNYVVFDPNMVDILNEYSLGGLVQSGYKHFSRPAG